jgi:hypothetical protein
VEIIKNREFMVEAIIHPEKKDTMTWLSGFFWILSRK